MTDPAAIENGERHTENAPHTIEFRNVGFTYPNTDVKVLENVNITIKQGEHLSVVGLNGAGKTTFIKLLCRLYDPTEDEILLDGVNIKEYDYAEYMSLFSPVFQDFKLFSFTIKENIALNEPCSDDELDKLIEQVGLSEKNASLEKGTATNLFKAFDENGIEPSGGEQQKIAIARALYKKAPVVILDEPTAASMQKCLRHRRSITRNKCMKAADGFSFAAVLFMAQLTLHYLIGVNIFQRCLADQTFFVHSDHLVNFVTVCLL